jgi:mono/diheme cytochrome c family protein
MLLLTTPLLVPAAAPKIDFPHSIVPILKAHCVECHGGHRSGGAGQGGRFALD